MRIIRKVQRLQASAASAANPPFLTLFQQLGRVGKALRSGRNRPALAADAGALAHQLERARTSLVAHLDVEAPALVLTGSERALIGAAAQHAGRVVLERYC